jgi:hypothetical protein
MNKSDNQSGSSTGLKQSSNTQLNSGRDCLDKKRAAKTPAFLEAWSASSGGAHFRGVDAEAEMGEVGLAEGH